MILRAAIVIAGLACSGQALAFVIAFPLDCTLGQTCYIQQFYDHDAGADWQDFTCGSLAYDGHDGTDFALPTRSAMATGVDVLAAAPGTVKGARDGVADFVPFQEGKECGNGVVVDHGGGWETQYCHLKQGSVTVSVGEAVDTGTPLGQIGQSGMAEFPHLHLSVRQNGLELDPFYPVNPATCGVAPSDDLWLQTPKYQAGGILGAGFSTEIPTFDAIKAGLIIPETLPQTAPALAMWVYLFGGQKGDAILFEILGPEGAIITERVAVERNRALFFHAVGRKMRGDGWPAGAYTGIAKLMRRGAMIDDTAISVTIAP
jgi:hypothetical protein